MINDKIPDFDDQSYKSAKDSIGDIDKRQPKLKKMNTQREKDIKMRTPMGKVEKNNKELSKKRNKTKSRHSSHNRTAAFSQMID